MLTLLTKFLKILNSEASPLQIGWAVAIGLLAGLMPFGPLTLLIVWVVCLFTINLSTFLLAWGLSKLLLILLAGPMEQLTWDYARTSWLLDLLSRYEILQFLHLHHTLVLGGLVLGLLLFAPVAGLSAILVRLYRVRVMSKVQQWKLMQWLKASKFVQFYQQS